LDDAEWPGPCLVAAHLTANLYYRWIGRRQQQGLVLAPHHAKAAVIRRILGFSLWNAVLQIGNVVTFTMPTFIAGKVLDSSSWSTTPSPS